MRKKKRWALIMAIVMLVLSLPNSMIQAQEIQSTIRYMVLIVRLARQLHLKVHSKQRFQKHQVPDWKTLIWALHILEMHL